MTARTLRPLLVTARFDRPLIVLLGLSRARRAPFGLTFDWPRLSDLLNALTPRFNLSTSFQRYDLRFLRNCQAIGASASTLCGCGLLGGMTYATIYAYTTTSCGINGGT